MDNVISSLVSQTPGTVAVIIVVAYFLRHLKERDALFLATMADLTTQIREMKTELIKHAEETSSGIQEMHRTVAARKRAKKAG